MLVFRALAAGVSALLLCMSCSTDPGVDVKTEEVVIRELHGEWVATFAGKDIEEAMKFFSDDAVLMPAHAPAIVGKEAIQAWFESWLPNPDVTSTFAPDVIEVAASGDFAYDRGTYQFTMQTADGLVRDSGKYVIVWKKIDGEWKTILDISNSDLATPELEPVED